MNLFKNKRVCKYTYSLKLHYISWKEAKNSCFHPNKQLKFPLMVQSLLSTSSKPSYNLHLLLVANIYFRQLLCHLWSNPKICQFFFFFVKDLSTVLEVWSIIAFFFLLMKDHVNAYEVKIIYEPTIQSMSYVIIRDNMQDNNQFIA